MHPDSDMEPLPMVAVTAEHGHGKYAGHTVPQLIGQLRKKEAIITRLRLRLRQIGDSARKQHKRVANTKTKQKHRKATEAKTAEHRGKKGRWYTPRGGFLLAARRCISNCAAYSVGLVIMRDLSHPTVTKWEIKFRAALVAASRMFVSHAVEDIAQHLVSKADGWKFLYNSYRSDATNANVWQRSKLHCTEISTTFTGAAVCDDSQLKHVIEQLHSRTVLGDIQVVKDSTGEGTFACIRKQIQSIGACRGDPNHNLTPLDDVAAKYLLDLSDSKPFGSSAAIQDNRITNLMWPFLFHPLSRNGNSPMLFISCC